MNMSKQELKQLENLRKKIGCPLNDCGQHIKFITNGDIAALHDSKKVIFTGQCTKCHRTFKLKQIHLGTFHAVYGPSKKIIVKSTFDDNFEVQN